MVRVVLGAGPSGEGGECGGGEAVVLVGGSAADGPDEAAVAGDAQAVAVDEQQRAVEGGGQAVTRAVGLDQVDEVGGRGVQGERGIRAAGLGPGVVMAGLPSLPMRFG